MCKKVKDKLALIVIRKTKVVDFLNFAVWCEVRKEIGT